MLGPLEYPESFLSVPRGRETPLAREVLRVVDERDGTLVSLAPTTMLANPLTRPVKGPFESDRLGASRRLRPGYGAVAERVIVGGGRDDDDTF